MGAQTLVLQALSLEPFPHSIYREPALLPARFADTQLGLRPQGWRNSHIRGSQSKEWKIHQTGMSWLPGAQGLKDPDTGVGRFSPVSTAGRARGVCEAEVLALRDRRPNKQPVKADSGSHGLERPEAGDKDKYEEPRNGQK